MPGIGTTKDVDQGYKELRRRWMNTKNSRLVAIGIFGEAASAGKEGIGPNGETIIDEEITNVLVAAAHEFGTQDGRVPERSWLRAYVDENRGKIRALIRKLTEQVLEGKLSHDQALGLIGAKTVAQIQNRIRRGLQPPLAEATKAARRGPDKKHKGPRIFKPLIDTGQMINSITWEVRRRGQSEGG